MFVIDKGDGEWGQFIYVSSSWVLIGTQESSYTDADKFGMTLTPASVGPVLIIGEVNVGSSITSLSVDVRIPFDDMDSTLSVGDDGDPERLMTSMHNDLTEVCDHQALPSYVYPNAADVDIKVYFDFMSSTTVWVNSLLLLNMSNESSNIRIFYLER